MTSFLVHLKEFQPNICCYSQININLYQNGGETSRTVETCHNRKREVPTLPIAIIKYIELVTKTKTQPAKSNRTLVCYPYIICSSVEHRSKGYPRKIEVQNMFKIKPVNFTATTTFKPPKINNVLVNVVAIVTIHNQQLE